MSGSEQHTVRYQFRTLGWLIALIIVLGGILFFFMRNDGGTDGPVACTLEAKICPDGSAVGRVGPNCEFAPCPGETPPGA